MGPRGGLREVGTSITGAVIVRMAALAFGRASGKGGRAGPAAVITPGPAAASLAILLVSRNIVVTPTTSARAPSEIY